jgi:methylated-DNA-[protein]-cysteine S-methyltransferase
MKVFDYYQSPLGRMMLVANDDGLAGVYFIGQKHYVRPGSGWRKDPDNESLGKAKKELEEYFAGKRKRFDLPLAPEGSDFQRAVWKAIAGVPFGETITYAELARRAGHPGSARAAGAATGRNPIGIIVPCHRIVGSDGTLTGYAGGLEKKKKLLALEAGAGSLI